MIFWKVVVFFLLITNILIYASVPTITLHDGHITLNDYLLKKDYHGTIIPGQPYTIDIYLSQSQHYDYVIESCVYNNKTTFISNNGCIIADEVFVDKWETTDYGYPNSLKRTLIHLIAPEPTLYIHCLLRLIECCSCAEKSCENPNRYNYYPYTPYQLIMSIPKVTISPSASPSILGGFNAPAFTSLMPQRLPVEKSDTSIWDQWWIWLIVILAILLLFCVPCLLAIFFLWKKRQEDKNKDKIITKDKNEDIETNGKNEMNDKIQKKILDTKKNTKTFHTNGHQHVHLPTNLDIYKLERDSLFSHSSDSFVNDEFETTTSQTKSAKIISNPHSTLPFHRLPVDVPENIIHEVKDHLRTTEPIRITKPYYKESQNFSEQMLKTSTYISPPIQQRQYQDTLRRSNDTIGVSKTHESVFI